MNTATPPEPAGGKRLEVGTIISQMRNPTLPYMLKAAGLDFFIIDTEHGNYTSETVGDLCIASAGAGITPFVRIPEIARAPILRSLDSCAGGLIVPQVESVEQAQEVVRHARYAPMGNRGAALGRAHSHFVKVNPEEYMAGANRRIRIALQIETVKGVERAREIAAVEGVDLLFVGPFDLSVSLGLPGQMQHDDVRRTIRKIFAEARSGGAAPAIHVTEPTAAREWVDLGCRFVSVAGDVTWIVGGARDATERVKTAAK